VCVSPKQKNAKRIRPPADVRPPESQAAIDEWIAERRKRFPTQARLAERAQNEADRDSRGALDLSTKHQKPKPGKRQKPIEMSTTAPTTIPSFLDRLTEDEDRRQHSMVLQCFRYFVTHNFLQDSPE
jgi:hypothetical protein